MSKRFLNARLGDFLKEADLKPHLFRYWENPKIEDEQVFNKQIKVVCDLYHKALLLYENGTYLVSTDEKCGMQALERKHPTLPMRPGLVERQEFEYKRHGTQTLIANFMVATGEIIKPSIGKTRTEKDFVKHIQNTVLINPDAKWIFIADQLNIHKSESLVKFVAKHDKIKTDLGVKGKSGILKSMNSRAEFLSDQNHNIRFVYTPKHASWMNQIELWFSILVRRLLKRASFKSIDELKQKILKFIEYFNQTMAKPFKWTYKGKPLTV